MVWEVLSYIAFTLGAITSALAALWIARKGDDTRPDRSAAIVALALTANWCFAAAAFEPGRTIVALSEIAGNLAWLFVLFRLFANDGRDESLRIVRPAFVALVLVESLQFVLLLIDKVNPAAPGVAESVFATMASFRVLVAVGAIVLLHNLYVGASSSSRQLLRWNAAALAGWWAFQLNFYTIAYLTNAVPAELNALRGIAAAAVAVPLAVGYNRHSALLQFSPSRVVTFHSLSLLVVGGYLLLMLGLAHWLDMFAADVARLTQVGLVIAAGALALVWLPSQKLRGWMRITAIKHLFKHRYDYRNEWIRFTHTVGRTGYDETSLQERVVKALADITDSESGLLLTPDEDGALALTANWRWPEMDVPSPALTAPLAAVLEREGLIVDLDEVRAGIDHHGECALVPEWLTAEPRAWAMVPLQHFDRLVGVVVLTRPLVSRKLDWEDFDLLGVVGRQLASYLAEQSGQAALLEASRFDEFNRRMAFVMHDIKNLSSQMSLLLRNAEKHADKPEFRKDMLVTLRNSADKLNTLLARLGRYAPPVNERGGSFDLAAVVQAAAERFRQQHPVTLVRAEQLLVQGDCEAFEQALAHLVQNAIDASDETSAVILEVFSDGVSGKLQIVDNGHGMSPQFLRGALFKPFLSSKKGGFGIGAFEARELIRAMGGRLDVESREGLGSRFTVSLPLQSTARILGKGSADASIQIENA